MSTITVPLRELPSQRACRQLRTWINDGTLPEGQPIPSENALALKLQVARATVRLALGQLEQEGVLRLASGRRRVVMQAKSGVTHSTLVDTIAILSTSSGQADPNLRQRGWSVYTQIAAAEAIDAAHFHVLTLNPDRLINERIERLIADRPRGVILFGSQLSPETGRPLLAALHEAKIPIVLYGSEEEFPQDDTVASDHARGAYELTCWLLAQGRKRILRVWTQQTSAASLPWLEQRNKGYERAMTEAGLPMIPALRIPSRRAEPTGGSPQAAFDYEARACAGYLLEAFDGKSEPDALMAISDGEAYMLAAACRVLRRDPVKELPIVGYDNYWADSPERPWTADYKPTATVDKRNLIWGRELVELLLARIAGSLPTEPQHRLVTPELVLP